ncbi:MAG: arsenic transporter, partial [Oscillospiraceae bacterium]|nr:arsenic transporter [Oscillospiraceae bacterium]
MNPMILALALFAVMYVLLLILSDKRWIVALATAAVFIILGILPVDSALGAINWNVLMMLAGTMAIVELFIQSQMPILMAEKLLQIMPNVQWAVVALSLFSGLISAFVDNVATVLMVAPVGLAVAKRLKTNPVPVIIAIAVSSNLQGAATLVGDTTSILLGSYAHMSFNDFFWFLGRPGICFAVEAGALMTVPILLILFRKEKEKVSAGVETKVTNYMPTVLLLSTIVLLIIASQFPNRPELTNGFICCALGVIGCVYELIRRRKTDTVMDVLKAIDYKTLLLLSGLFMVIEGITQAGVIDAIAALFVKAGGGSKVLMYVLIVGVSVLLSAFIDNIP